MKLLFLTGMPGAGKSYWAKQLGAVYNMPFIDLDAFIEEQEGASIAQIFDIYGEVAFRARESAALGQIITSIAPPAVIACGGGTPVYNNNLQLMKQQGIVVYLKAAIATIVHNLQSDHTSRPMLRNGDTEQKLKALLEKRKQFYEAADDILEVENLSVATFAQIIARCTDRPL